MNANGNLPVNWFDVFVLLMLLIGYSRGKKNGMSQESLAMLKWIAVMLIPAIAYEPLGLWLATTAQLGKLTAYLTAYAISDGARGGLDFHPGDRAARRKNQGQRCVRQSPNSTWPCRRECCGSPAWSSCCWRCLNARYYSTAEVQGVPRNTIRTTTAAVSFRTSTRFRMTCSKTRSSGSQIHKHLDFLLIKPTPAILGPTAPAQPQRVFVAIILAPISELIKMPAWPG
jgi:hypothetical protein